MAEFGDGREERLDALELESELRRRRAQAGARAIISKVCRKYKNSDLRADDKDILAAIDAELAAKDRRIEQLESEARSMQAHLEATNRVLFATDDRNDKIDLELIRLRGALGQIANNEDPDAHWSLDVARSALKSVPEEKIEPTDTQVLKWIAKTPGVVIVANDKHQFACYQGASPVSDWHDTGIAAFRAAAKKALRTV